MIHLNSICWSTPWAIQFWSTPSRNYCGVHKVSTIFLSCYFQLLFVIGFCYLKKGYFYSVTVYQFIIFDHTLFLNLPEDEKEIFNSVDDNLISCHNPCNVWLLSIWNKKESFRQKYFRFKYHGYGFIQFEQFRDE